MKRHWVLALAALVFLPAIASAQSTTLFGPQLRITPWVGVSPGYSQKGDATVFTANDISGRQYQIDYASSLPIGLNVEYRFWNRFGAMLGAAWSRRGNATLIDFDNIDQPYTIAGTDLWTAKLDLAVHMYEINPDMQMRRINASVFAGPVFMKDRVRADIFTPNEATNTVDQWGVNLGAEAEVPTANSHLALVIGAEDNLVLWNNNKYRRRVEGYVRTTTPDAAVLIDAKMSQAVIGRIGLSYRF